MQNAPVLYGDGIHDDFPAIQAMIDSGVCEVALPAPRVRYLISKTLTLPSHFKLSLPRFAEIRLADQANCFMVQSQTVSKPARRLAEGINEKCRFFWHYVDELSPDPEDACCNFEIEGGIWNFNNMNQQANPQQTGVLDRESYFLGHGMFFYNVRNFRLSNMTMKDPTNYCVMIDHASYFTFENIDFDFNYGNPYAVNMDGIHLNGNCANGVIRNLKGACYDDLVALNAHEGSCGDIKNIDIDGIFAENCHSAVRMLTVCSDVSNVRIANVYGTYYQYCIGFTKYYAGLTTGRFDAIVLENISASKARRLPVQETHMDDKQYVFPLIWIQEQTHVKTLSIHGVHRREYVNPVGTIVIDPNATVDCLSVQDVTLENHTGKPCAKLHNRGLIKMLLASGIDKDEIVNHGTIEKCRLIFSEGDFIR